MNIKVEQYVGMGMVLMPHLQAGPPLQAYSSVFKSIQVYSSVFKCIQAYSWVFLCILVYSCVKCGGGDVKMLVQAVRVHHLLRRSQS